MGADSGVEHTKMARDNMRQLIAQWNANRLDLFHISEPNEDEEFHGVMRFYFQEAGAKVATKCIRVASSATAKAVIETLIEKFRPDMRMLSIPQYALYEIHENGEERRLEDSERPLLVQLNWHSDDREGRFLLRRIDEKANKMPEIPLSELSFKRKLSKREKKQLKKLQEKTRSEAASVAEKLYTELPETSFTRSISNPEAVMRRRRQQKLEKKLAQFRSRDGGPDTGGTLKIYGESLCRDVPYKTLLLSVNDTAVFVVKEMLAKYSLTTYDPQQYCLVQVCEGEGEYILEDDESPLSILMNQPPNRGSIMFHVRRRPPDFHPRKRKKKPGRRADEDLASGYRGSYDGQMEPLLIELLPDGSETGRRITLENEVTEVGSDWGGLQLAGLRPRHCVIANTEGIVTVTPSSRDADIYVNGQRIYETSLLQNGTILRFGRTHYFRFAQRGRPFAEREVAEHSQSQLINTTTLMTATTLNTTTTGGGTMTQSPPLSPSTEDMPRVRADTILPATLELPEAGEEGFLSAVVMNVTPTTLQFKLAPTYALYLAARYRATTHFRPEATPHERAHLLSAFLLRVAHIMMQSVQERNTDANYLAFWMANSSELLHFLKSDRQIGAFSLDAQDVLADVVQLAFRHLVTTIQAELANLIGIFLLERDEDDEKATAPVLGVLGSGMTLLRRCRVNAALTIQLFSQLFHFINMAVFNKIIGMDGGRNYCSRVWGTRLRRRLNRIETWAEKQGLELAADCHLVRVVQAAHLLQSPKNSAEELATTATSCFKLNSHQLRCLLMKYQYEQDEVPIPADILDSVIRVAESTVDEVIRTDGRHVRVEEEPLLGLAFLLPEDGYSCDIVRGVPAGLVEFLAPLAPLCRLTPNPSAAGYWTIFFQDPMRSPSAMSGRSFATAFTNPGAPNQLTSPMTPGSYGPNGIVSNSTSVTTMMNSVTSLNSPTAGGHPLHPPFSSSATTGTSNGLHNGSVSSSSNGPRNILASAAGEPEVQTIKLQKLNSGLGLSIVAAKGVGQDRLGIYIKSVVPGGSADMDGRLQDGDQLLSVDGQSLVGITQEKAAEYLVRTGPVVTLEVAKQAAIYQGLATMLSQPSPVMSRAGGPQARRMSERDLPSKVMREAQLQSQQQHHQQGAQGAHPVDMESAPHHSAILQPRIHSSKSVPSLNSDRDHHVGSMPMSNSIVGPGMLSPGVMNNSSVPSAAMIRSSGGYPLGHPDSGGGGGLRGYPPVNYPSMTMQPKTSHHYPAPSDPHRSRSIQSLATDPGLNRADIGAKSTPSLHQGGGEDERYYQNVGFYPPPPPPPNPTTNPAANMPLRTYIPYSSSAGNLQSSSSPHLTPTAGTAPGQFRPMPGGSYRGPPPNLIQANWQQQQQRQQLQQQQQQQQMNLQMGHHQRDLMRQEAKMLEMQDELRRREERAALMMTKAQQHQNRYAPRFTYTPTPPMIQQQQLLLQQQQHRMSGPPTVPTKPNRPDSLLDNGGGPGRPPLPDEYKFNSREPPTGAFTFNNGMMNKQLGGNPWENAEKERDLQRRKEMARFWRDQQIQDLESMPTRNPAQDEQLRTLRLEREFQRRAEENRREDDGEGNEEEEEEDERKAMVRRVQEDLERTRISGTHLPATNGNRLDPMEEERARKMEEIRRKKMELEAAQAAEERLVREATKRREEELRRQQSQILQQQNNNQHHQMMNQQQQQQMHIQQSYSSASYRTSYSSSSKISPDQHQPQQTSPNAGGVSGGLTSPSRSQAPPLPTSPPPNTTRPTTITNNGNGFSGNSVGTPEKSPVTPPQSSPRPKSDKKTVSFNETVATNEPPESPVDSPPVEKVREDPNRFISEAQALLSSPRSPDGTGVGSSLNTPGVIGAQEVYRDPRWRRLQEQQKQQAANAPKPEKLTFKEKMKMFAMESGEDATPKDKVKVSKAQREIETFPTPTK